MLTRIRWRMCRRTSSCCTASPAPGARGTASSSGSEPERYTPLALDLPGHGDCGGLPSDHLRCLRRARARPQPSRVRALRLLARRARRACTSRWPRPSGCRGWCWYRVPPGIADDAERAARTSGRRRACGRPRSAPFEEFMDRWAAQPVFAERSPRGARRDARRTATQRPATRWRPCCAASAPGRCRRCGAVWTELEMPVTVLVGERDTKFHAPGRRMVELLPDCGAAHRARRASPAAGELRRPSQTPSCGRSHWQSLASVPRLAEGSRGRPGSTPSGSFVGA